MSLFLRPQAQPVTAAVQPAQLRRATAAPYNAKRAIAASAAPVRLGGLQQQRPYAEWQRYAWTGYEKVGEIFYGLDQLAKLVSRIRIFAGAVIDSGDAPVVAHEAAADNHIDSALAADATKAIEDLVAGDFSSMLRSFTLNISVVGEAHLVRMPDVPARTVDPLAGGPTPEPTFTWVIRSTDEVQVKPTGVELVPMRGATSETRQLPADTYIARIWRASARFSGEPDSSLRGIGEVIEELLLLSRVTRSGARSRLNAGMVFVPDSIVIANATKSDAAGDGVADAGGQFLEDLMDAMVTPITDEGSAAGVVPMLVSGPATEGEKIRHITFERKADEKNTADKERALERILQGLDVPKEIVTGLANVKYSNALVIDENLYKANIEPLALMFVDAMTQVYLRPVLRGLTKPGTAEPKYTEADLAKVVIWYDPSEIVTRPDAAADATEGYNLGLLSGAAWRQAHGYSESDAPDEMELLRMLVTRATTTLPGDVLSTFLQKVFPETLGAARDANIAAQVVPFPQSAQSILSGEPPTAPAAAPAEPAPAAASGRRRA